MEVISFPEIELEPESIADRLRFSDKGLLSKLIDLVRTVMVPKVAYQASYLDEKRDDSVVVEGVYFKSRVLRCNLDRVDRVFPFVLTLGKSLDEVIGAAKDILEKYILDEIGNFALRETRNHFEKQLRAVFALDNVSFMSPGSLMDWPIEEQRNLFTLLKDVESRIAVQLTESCLMIPLKSVSGIYFPSSVTFYSCRLCPRESCRSRKARFDPVKAREYGFGTPSFD